MALEIIQGPYIQRVKKSRDVDMPVQSYEKCLQILSLGRRDGCVAETDQNHLMSSSSTIALFCSKHEEDLIIQKQFCNSGVATAGGYSGVLDEPKPQHVSRNFRFSSMEELHVVPQLEWHCKIHGALEEVRIFGFLLPNDGQYIVVTVDQNNHM